jgi:hypothetical protein
MKLLIKTLFASIMLLAFSCDENECCNEGDPESRSIYGSWLLVERGYSPGSGYFINPVEPSPAQTLNIKRDGIMSSNINELNEFRFYYVEDDVVPESKVISFFKTDPGPSPDPSTFTVSYTLTREGSKLILGYRYCFEGCHLGFKKAD